MKCPACRLWPSLLVILIFHGCAVLGDPAKTTRSNAAHRAAIHTASCVESAQDIQADNLIPGLKFHAFEYAYYTDRSNARFSHPDKETVVGRDHHLNFPVSTGVASHLKHEFFNNSGKAWPTVAKKNFQFSFNDRWRLGADLSSLQSQTDGEMFRLIVPTPRLTYEYGAVKLSTLYLPPVQGYNQNPTMGVYFIIIF
jgi:hypothetical protein